MGGDEKVKVGETCGVQINTFFLHASSAIVIVIAPLPRVGWHLF